MNERKPSDYLKAMIIEFERFDEFLMLYYAGGRNRTGTPIK